MDLKNQGERQPTGPVGVARFEDHLPSSVRPATTRYGVINWLSGKSRCVSVIQCPTNISKDKFT